jgi:transcriptional regulator with XRE-family HTH domain
MEPERGELYVKLRGLWQDAGRPAMRALARDLAFSHTTVAEAINGTRIPSMAKLKRIVEELDGDWEEFKPLYPEVAVTRPQAQRDLMLAILAELRAIRVLMEEKR